MAVYVRSDNNGAAGKADKVAGATAGNLASLDGTGNLADSGVAPGDLLTTTAAAATYSVLAHSHAVADVMGLQAALDAKAAAAHVHDDRYYTQSQVNTLLGSYLTTAAAASTYATIASMQSLGSDLVTLDGQVATHALSTTDVHGIADTAELVTNSSLATALGPYLTTATAASTYQTQAGMVNYVTTATLGGHTGATTSVHGISNTANLAYRTASNAWTAAQTIATLSTQTLHVAYGTEVSDVSFTVLTIGQDNSANYAASPFRLRFDPMDNWFYFDDGADTPLNFRATAITAGSFVGDGSNLTGVAKTGTSNTFTAQQTISTGGLRLGGTDAGLDRYATNWLKVTNGSTGYGSLFLANVATSSGTTQIGGSEFQLGSGLALNWSSTTSFAGAKDVGLARSSAGVVKVTNGSTGTGNLTAGTVTATSFSGSGASLTSLNASNISGGTIANARTTATDQPNGNTIVMRDASGNFSTNIVTATGFQFVDSNWRWFRDDANEIGPQFSLITKGFGAGSGSSAREFMWYDAPGTKRMGVIIGTTIASSGTMNAMYLNADILTSGTAGYNAFKITATEHGTGSGENNLLWLGTNTGKKFAVSNAGVVYMANTSAPATPSGGGHLFVDGGSLKFKGSSGTVTTIAPA